MKIAAITNRELARANYWDQLEQIAASDVDTIILREKTLSEEEYADYAKKALRLCNLHNKTCILHHFGKVAVRFHVPCFQCSLEYLETHSSLLYYITTLGVSVHTPEEAVRAEKLGATYIMASHVFPTDCKKGLPPIGPQTVQDICSSVSIPVYALGGINLQTVTALRHIPVSGIALMSGFMTSNNVSSYVRNLRNSFYHKEGALP